jgi:membrane protein CcdC involved in cytochrome C biogenesis
MATSYHTAAAVLITLAGAAIMLAWRIRETMTPVSTARIILPPLAMSTGFVMFLAPATRIPWSWGLAAFLIGALLLFYPLSRTSTLERRGGIIMMQRSQAFVGILLALLAVRFGLRGYVGAVLSVPQTGALLFVLSFGMILRWRTDMLVRYRRLSREHA